MGSYVDGIWELCHVGYHVARALFRRKRVVESVSFKSMVRVSRNHPVLGPRALVLVGSWEPLLRTEVTGAKL